MAGLLGPGHTLDAGVMLNESLKNTAKSSSPFPKN